MKNIIDFYQPKLPEILAIFHGGTEKTEKESTEQYPKQPGLFFWKDSGKKKSAGEKQQNVHIIAQQNFPASAAVDFPIGMKRNQIGRCICPGRAADHGGIGQNADPGQKKRRQNRLPPDLFLKIFF